jgi:hypothetical protein
MQENLARGAGASSVRTVSRLTLFAGVPLIAALALSAPALAACGVRRPAGVHSAATGTGVHTATSRPSSGGSASGGSGTLGCANGASAPAPHGLSIASSGRVVEGGVHPAAHTATHARTAAKPANATAHMRSVKSPHA